MRPIAMAALTRRARWIWMLVLAAACASPSAEPARKPHLAAGGSAPYRAELAMAEARGLPQHLVPGDAASVRMSQRGECATLLHDSSDSTVALRLQRSVRRLDWWRDGDTTATSRWAEGEYLVSPTGKYGLNEGEYLRVNCALLAAITVVATAR